MDELIDVVDHNGLPTGKTCYKSFAHQNGIRHASVHVWFYTEQQQILIQKRKDTKYVYPDFWDVSVAGHIGSGEQPITSAIREVEEEIGYTIHEQELQFLKTWEDKHTHANGITDHEIHFLYLAKLNATLEQLCIQEEEVAAIQLIDIDEFEESFGDTTKFVPHPKEYYQYIVKKVKEQF